MPDYILEPLDTDPDAILDEAVAYIQSVFPGWEPSEGQLDWIILRVVSFKQAVLADMASRVQRSIFRYFGSSIVNVQPISGAQAEVSTTWTAIDDAGHTIAADTLIGIRDPTTDDLQIFAVVDETVIDPGQTLAVGVIARAIEDGAIANGLSGTVDLIESIDWVQSIVTVAPSSGGADPEDDDSYLDRLATNLGLMSPRPILAGDFALISRNVSGVWRAIALDNYTPGNDEVQTVTHDYTGGHFHLIWNGQTTGEIPWNATASQVQTALEALSNIYPGDVRVTGGPLPTIVTVTFIGRLGESNVAAMTYDSTALTGGSTFTITTTTAGTTGNASAANAVAVAAVDESGGGITTATKAELDAYLQAMRQQNFIVSVLDPSFNTIDCSFTVVKYSGYSDAEVETATEAAVAAYLDPATWGLPRYPPDERGWERKTALRVQELYTVLNNTDGVDYVSALTTGLNGAAQDGTDKTLVGTFPITVIGTIAGTVT